MINYVSYKTFIFSLLVGKDPSEKEIANEKQINESYDSNETIDSLKSLQENLSKLNAAISVMRIELNNKIK